MKRPVYRYARRAYFIIDKTGTVKFMKVMDNSLDLLDAEEVLTPDLPVGIAKGVREFP
jgi:alkyl hydroperoxide reductase subunit AhpC